MLTGSKLTNARFTLGGALLVVKASSDRQATVVVPKDVSPGAAILTVANECGQSAVRVKVAAAPPEVVELDPPRVAAAGILEVTTDVFDPALITSAELGSLAFPASDAGLFRVVPRRDPSANVVIALRIPAETYPGTYALRLKGPAGTSAETPVEVIVPKGPLPPPPVKRCDPVVARSLAAPATAFSAFVDVFWVGFPWFWALDDETLPLGSGNDGGILRLSCHHDNEARREWFYDFLGMAQDQTCGSTGTIEGFEAYCPRAEGCQLPDPSLIYRSTCRPTTYDPPIPNLRCSPLKGTYQLNSKANQVRLTIDRGDGPEEYVGGWGLGDEMTPPTSDGFYRSANLVLRSKRTGLQLVVRNGLESRDFCR